MFTHIGSNPPTRCNFRRVIIGEIGTIWIKSLAVRSKKASAATMFG